jgi:hypothetical protein
MPMRGQKWGDVENLSGTWVRGEKENILNRVPGKKFTDEAAWCHSPENQNLESQITRTKQDDFENTFVVHNTKQCFFFGRLFSVSCYLPMN